MVKRWVPDFVPGAASIQMTTIADLIVWLDQQGIPPAERPELWKVAGVSPEQVAEAEEWVAELYRTKLFKSRVGKQRHGKKW